MCIALGDGVGDAEDVVQESFVRAARVIPALHTSAVRPYLRTTVVNLRRDRSRRGGRRSRTLEPVATEQDHAGPVVEREVVWGALLRLSPRQRECLVLRFYEDLAEREIAGLLRCSVGSVKVHVHRGLRRLKAEVTR